MFVVRTTIYRVEGDTETAIAEDESEDFPDIEDAMAEFESRADVPAEDCLLVEVPELSGEEDDEE